MTRRGLPRVAGALALAAIVVFSMVAASFGAVAATNNKANWSSSAAPDVEIVEESVTIASHDRSEMSSLLEYENDDGDIDALPARLNDSVNNSVGVHYSRIDDEQWMQFPRKSDEENNSASWADASEWTKDASGSAGSGSVSEADGSTAAGVEALQFSTSSQTSSDVMTFTYSNVSIDTDAEKRVARLVFNVDTLDSGAQGTVEFADADGDTKVVAINSSRDATADDVAASSTGTSFVYQSRLADLSTDGSGDGSFDGIEEVRVKIADANADVTFVYMDGDPKNTLAMGETLEDTDSDDDLETTEIDQKTSSGEQRLDSLAGMGSWADDAVINDLEVYGLIYEPQHLPSEDVVVEFDPGFEQDYGSYDHGSATYLRFDVPAQIDVQHHGLTLRLGEQAYVSDRYINLDVAEGTGSTGLTDVESWSDVTGSLVDKGDEATLDNTVPTGENVDVRVRLLQNPDEFDTYQATGSSGSGATSGGLGSLPIIGGAIAVLLAWLGRLRGE